MYSREYYHRLRNAYLPEKLKTIFVLESPPVSGKYFYDTTGRTTEPLFSAMMRLLEIKPANKLEGLNAFEKAGCMIVDATYKPVNQYTGKYRNEIILSDFSLLVDDLKKLCQSNDPQIILVKANVCDLLENRLVEVGFKIKNQGIRIPFPSSGQQGNFARLMKDLY